MDNFTLFHYKFLRVGSPSPRFWEEMINDPGKNAWCGIAFERVCLQHVEQIKATLGISGVQTETCSWACGRDDDAGVFGSQIDLLIVRKDQVINLCEMKYAPDEYAVTKRDELDIRRKVSDFQLLTGTRSAVHVTLVTPYGLRDNIHAGIVQNVVTAEGLM